MENPHCYRHAVVAIQKYATYFCHSKPMANFITPNSSYNFATKNENHKK